MSVKDFFTGTKTTVYSISKSFNTAKYENYCWLTDRLRNIQVRNDALIFHQSNRENEESILTIKLKPYILMETSGRSVWSVSCCLCGTVTCSVICDRRSTCLFQVLLKWSCFLSYSAKKIFWQQDQKKRWIHDLSWNKTDGFSQHCRGIHLILYLKYDGGSTPN